MPGTAVHRPGPPVVHPEAEERQDSGERRGRIAPASYSAVADMALRPLELKYPPVADLSAASGGRRMLVL